MTQSEKTGRSLVGQSIIKVVKDNQLKSSLTIVSFLVHHTNK